MKVRFLQDQQYRDLQGFICFAKAGDIVENLDYSFAKLIAKKIEKVEENAQVEAVVEQEKPLEKMTKNELVARARMSGIDLADDELDKITKAEIIKLIQNV